MVEEQIPCVFGADKVKTENEIQNVINWLGIEDADDPGDDLPFIENARAFKEALLWVLQPSAVQKSNNLKIASLQ